MQIHHRGAVLAAPLARWLSLAFILTIVLSMGLSGWFALHEGATRFMLPFTTHDATEVVTEAVVTARANPDLHTIRGVSEELWALAGATSAERFTTSKILEQGIYYTTMPRTNQILLAAHVLTGVFCMLLGGLQFWPAFRKRYMKVHRAIGMIYLLTVPVSVLTSLAYLALTPPYRIYAHLVGWVALWAFGILALIAVSEAIRALRLRRIYEHQAWMAFSFGCLMVAPLLRLDWVLLAWCFPHIDQETLNLVTTGLMLPQTLLIAYGLILVNRQFARPLRNRQPSALARQSAPVFIRALPALLLLALVMAVSNAWFYLVKQGLSGLAMAADRVPEALRLKEQAVLAGYPLATLLLVTGLSLAWPAALLALKRLLQDDFAPSRLANGAGLLAVLAGVSAVWLGWHIGLAPDMALASGGTLYLVNGAVIAGFGLLLLAMQRVGQIALMKESLVFLICLLPFPSLFLATFVVFSQLPLPPVFLSGEQGVVLPVGFSGALLFIAMIHVVHGQATREHN